MNPEITEMLEEIELLLYKGAYKKALLAIERAKKEQLIELQQYNEDIEELYQQSLDTRLIEMGINSYEELPF